MASAYDTAAALMGKTTDLYSGIAGGPNASVAGQALADQMLGLLPNSVTQAGVTASGYGPTDINAATVGSMNSYLNPFYEQVLSAAMGKMGDARDMSLNSLGASATAAGAFGGSRHGIAEGQVHSDFIKNSGDLAAQLKAQGFNTALTAAQTGVGQELNRGQFLSGTQAQLDSQKAGFDSGAALNLALARPGVLGQGFQIGMSADAQDTQRRALAASGLGAAAGDYYSVGTDITNQQASQGAQVQELLQRILSGGANQFDSFMKSPYDAINLMQGLLSADPRRGNINSTGTTQATPGIMDWLATAIGTIGAGRGA